MNSIERIEVPIKELPNGQHLLLSYFEIKGKEAGPHVHIQSSVHGAEIQGNVVIYKLLEYLKEHPIKGSMTIIPQANPIAANQKSGTHTTGRFNPTTGDNWNRNYTELLKVKEEVSKFNLDKFIEENKSNDWEVIKKHYKMELQKICIEILANQKINNLAVSDNRKLNLILQSLGVRGDIVLDLHTGPVATKYLYSAYYAQEDAFKLNFPHILFFPAAFAGAMDEASFCPWVGLWEKLDAAGIAYEKDVYAYTLELGSEEVIDTDSATEDLDRVLSYLAGKDIIAFEKDMTTTMNYCDLNDFKTYYSARGGVVEFHKNPGDHYQKDELLATIYNFSHIQGFDDLANGKINVHAPEDGIVINHFPSCNISEGVELFQVMTNHKILN